MKFSKRIGLGGVLVPALALVALFFGVSRVWAAGGPFQTSSDWSDNTIYTLNQKGIIAVTFPGGDHDPVNFTDSAPNDSIHTYVPDTSGTGVCGGTITFDSGQDFSNKPISAKVNVNYEAGPTPTCTGGAHDGANSNYSHSITVTNNTTNGGSTPANNGPGTIAYDGQTYSQVSGSPRVYGLSAKVGTDCYGGSIIVLDKIDTSGTQGTILPLINGSSGTSPQTELPNFPSPPPSFTTSANQQCYYNSNADNGDHVLLSVDSSGNATFAGCSNGDSACQAQTNTTTQGGGGTAPNSCESGYTGAGHEFNWIFCKMLAGIDSLTNTFLGIVQGQLDVCTGTSSTTGSTCSNNILDNQVKQAWSIFRILATSLLVIIMLVMVLSQAIGGGPFDAYTVRKVLPKLIAAAILMQLSWYMFKFVIDVVNDVGTGIAQLMYFPFGGAGKMTLDNLIGGVGVVAPGFTVTTLFTGIVVGYIASGLTIFGVAFLGISVVISLIVGLLVLLFRQILIILLMIFSPLALAAWILPGTERYWKMWWDNFIKVLFMFPMIMAMIAGGRIFAYVGSSQGVLGLFVVLLGFFGPLWFLPKTFKWGGQAFGSLATATWNGTQRMRNFPGQYALQGAHHNREERATQRAARLANNPNNRRMLDRVLAGEFNVTKQRGHGGELGAREMSFAKTLSEGEKATRESVPAQLLRSGYDSWRHGPALNERGERIREGEEGYEINKLDANQAWLEGRTYAGITPDAALRGHAFDTLVQLGDPDRIRMARQNSEIPEEVWSKAVARNFPKLNEIARYLTLAPDLSNLAVRQYTTQDDDTAQELVRQLEGHYIYDRETGGRVEQTTAQHREALQRAADLAADARNPLIWVDLGQTKKQVINQIETMAAAEGITGVSADDRRRRTVAPTPPATPPPPPPAGPGPEDDEAEIDIDHGA